MTKHEDRYYLQYACPGTQYNTYSDGVYVSSSPLGPFNLADNNPYSYKPGGFLPGAGHGSTMQDAQQQGFELSRQERKLLKDDGGFTPRDDHDGSDGPKVIPFRRK